MYEQTILHNPLDSLNKIKIYNLTPDDFQKVEILSPKANSETTSNDIWKVKPPEVIHSKKIGMLELSGIHDKTAKSKNTDWYISFSYQIGNTGQTLHFNYYRDENIEGRFKSRTASAWLILDDMKCDNDFYFMMFNDEDDLHSTRLLIKKILRDKNITFTAKSLPPLLNDNNHNTVIVNSHGQVEFTTETLLKNKRDKKLTYLRKSVVYDHEFADDDTPGEYNSTDITHEGKLWEHEDRGLHCPDADPFDFTFPHKYTAPGLTFTITAIFIVDAQNNKTETHTFAVVSEKTPVK
ncbi:hypothetical protein D3C81_263810 [compost metagenome]